LPQVTAVGEFNLECFFADERVRKVDRIRDVVAIRRVHRDEFVSLPHLYFPKNLEILAGTALFADAGLLNQLYKWERASIQNGELEIVQFHDRVIDAEAD